MNSDRVPSRSEVMGWSPQQLADYLKRMNLSGCDKVVMKNSISGSRFVNLSDNDLQKFPKLHTPMISKISIEIGKKEEKRGLFGKKSSAPKYQEPADVTTADDQGWDDDEFDDEGDYESPYSDEGSVGDYESPAEDLDMAGEYEPPPSEPPEDHKLCLTTPLGDGEYIDKRGNLFPGGGPPPAVCPRPPIATLSARMPGESSSRRDPSPHCAGRPSGKFPPEPPQIFRGNKPGRDSGSNPSPVRGRNIRNKPEAQQSWRSPPDISDPPSWSKPPVPPPATSVSRSNSSARPSPGRFEGRKEPALDEASKINTYPIHRASHSPRPAVSGPHQRQSESLPPGVPAAGTLPHRLHSAMAEQRSGLAGPDRSPFPLPPTTSFTEDLDPRWYVGKVTRGQAEGCLKQVRKDGAYLVRDSIRQQANQPFTLMVYYQDKVYNVQIRQQNQQYQLGTGLKVQESFLSVSDIISHYSQSPLLLIDAKNRSASQQNQCLLSDPVGYYMTRQNWS
ncbi:lymphocyte cytosolic protein 2a [Melanotaenia boesemani]|uniref:lymphocyte cytosolic protein 2a n=1 Tax=Melanotaenia boesemani TaxID=1250792 RepID=UPI001C03C106|nr:lymphocyte cytosolic protein 2a [Melanotaenia boesemani]